MDLATKIVGFVVFALAVAGIIYRQGKSDQKTESSINHLAQQIETQVQALKAGQAENRAKADEVLAEVKAHMGTAGIHVNTQLEALKDKVDEERYKDLARKLDEILRVK